MLVKKVKYVSGRKCELVGLPCKLLVESTANGRNILSENYTRILGVSDCVF